MSVEREPAGLAQQAVPLKDAKGRLVLPFILNSHWINGSSQPHEASVVVKLVPAKPHTVRRLTKPIFAVTANAALDVPPGTVRSTESSTAAADAVVGRLGFKLVDAWGPGMADFGAAFGGAPIPQGPACVTYLFGHMHKRGEVFGIDFIASDGTVQNGPPSSQLENPDEPGRYHLYLGTRPIVEAMHLEALQQPYLCTDATGVLVQAPEQCRQGHFWVLIAPALHVLFRYSARHDKEAVDGLLPGYQGVLVADAHSVYDHLFADGVVTEAGCWSHLRRYWFKTLGSEPEKGREALAMIGALFAIERSLVDAPPARRLVVRHEMSRPLVKQFFDWCLALKDTALDETPLAKALGYATNHQKAFERFLDDGRLPMHNNWSELQLRRQVIGRRNWIFTGSDDGAEVNTVFVSLLASCGLHQLEPWTYLRDLFCLLPSWPRSRVLALAPAYWKRTFEDEETQQKLADNPFRSAVLALDRVHPDDP